MKIGIVINPLIEEAVRLAKKLKEKIPAPHELLFDERTARALDEKASDISEAEVVITLGGDGTVLRAHALAQDAHILAINMGDRGFLAEVKKDEAERAVELLLEKKLEVVERTRLKVEFGEKIPEALNDVVIFSAVPGKTVTLKVSVDGKKIFSFRGDGVIVSTPTGSTAYTRAAGGPIIFPGVECIVVTAICPSSKPIPPIVLPAKSRVDVEVCLPGQEGLLIVDGLERARLPHGSVVKISASESGAKFFKWGEFCRSLEKIL
ncbi:MAG: NAD(+)/NADH kinase [Candidatus Hadarchaeales archaeon]